MRKPRWNGRAALLVAVGTAALLGAVSPGEAPDPLRLEDVVRMHVAGTPAVRIVELIRASSVEFDVAPEMLEELRIAGLPDEVIQAVVERQRELHPPAPAAATPAAEAPARPGLTVGLHPARGDRRALRLPSAIDSGAREHLGLDPDETRFTNLALYVACLTPTHVPDHWRAQSPLGRDFVSMPRHRLLAFLPGPARAGEAETDSLELELPDSVAVELEPGEEHDLSVGLALRAGDRYYRIASDTWQGLRPADGEQRVEAEVEGRGATVTVRFRR